MLNRSLLFVPAHDEKKIKSALLKRPDRIILDLEDAVPYTEKEQARKNISAFSKNSNEIIIRVNSEIELIEKDIKYLENAHSVIIPKIKTVSHFQFLLGILAEVITKKTQIMPLIETPEAIEDIVAISGLCSQTSALIFGAEDYKSELGARTMASNRNMDYARSKILNTARCRNILAIDSPYLSYGSKKQMAAHYADSCTFGFDGCLLIHPNQISSCNEAYLPSFEELEWAQQVVSKMQEESGGPESIFVVNNSIVGPPMQKKALRLISFMRMERYNHNSHSEE